MKKTCYIATFLVAMLLKAGVAHAGIIEVPPSQIAIISPGENVPDLSLGPRVCLKFNIPDEARGVEIGFAQIVMHISLPVVTEDSAAILEAFPLNSAWSEGAGWNDFPVGGGAIDSSYYEKCIHWCGKDTLSHFDITPLARHWNEMPGSNHGLLIIPRMTDFNSFRQFRFQPGQLRNLITLRILVPGWSE